MNSNATRLADLPDWLLVRLGGRSLGRAEPRVDHRCLAHVCPLPAARISFDTAQAMIAEHAADLARPEDLSGRITVFRLSCCFERLKHSGRFEDVIIDDPFDPESQVAAKLTEEKWQSVNPTRERRGTARLQPELASRRADRVSCTRRLTPCSAAPP
jgi:hypothetical protein